MFLSRVRIKLCEDTIKYLDGIAKNDFYTSHQLLWKLFPEDQNSKRDFLFRAEQEEGWPLYYVLSRRQPVLTSDLFSIQSKLFEPSIAKGQKLFFDVRANPVVAKKVDGKKNSVHHDVWMNAKKIAKAENYSQKEAEELKSQSTKEWFITRSIQYGFTIESDKLQIVAYQQNRAFKKGQPSLHYSTVDYKGILTVTDVDKFNLALHNGIGRAKAFGCGLLLIKPI